MKLRLYGKGCPGSRCERTNCLCSGHIPNTLNIWKNGLPAYAGWFLNYEEPIIIVDDNNGNIDELRRYLVRLGYDNIYDTSLEFSCMV